MPSPHNRTRSGLIRDPVANFSTTHWSIILDARNRESPTADAALETLCRNYWPPLYGYLRREGYSPHDAEDLVQAFFERLVAKEFLQDVAPQKGRFRSFLLVALRNFVANHRRSNCAQRRGGQQQHLAIDISEVENHFHADSCQQEAPELTFDRSWAMTVLARARERLEQEQKVAGREGIFGIFGAWLFVEPSEGEYASVIQELGMSRSYASVTVHRMRKRFRDLLRQEIIHTVTAPEELEAEYNYLLEILARP